MHTAMNGKNRNLLSSLPAMRLLRACLPLLLLLFPRQGPAQSADLPALLLRPGFNKIYFNQAQALDHFFGSLDSLIRFGDRKLNILHLGDSHLQGGFFSNAMRIRLQSTPFFSNGGRGLLFPYKPARTNGPLHYGVEYTGRWLHEKCTDAGRKFKIGVCGYTVATDDSSATLKIWTSTRHGNPPYDFDRVSVWHSRGSLRAMVDDALLRSAERKEWGTVFYLDSLRDTITLRFLPDTFRGMTEIHGILLDNEDPGIVYHALGVNGATVADFASAELLVEQAQRLHPELIILSFGSNDAYYPSFDTSRFRRDYSALIDSLLKAAPRASVLLTTPGDAYFRKRYFNYNYVKARKVILDLARARGLAVWDFYAVMGGPNSIFEWFRHGYAQPDKMHLTQKGYALQGALFYKALMNAYYEYLDAE